MLAPAAKNLFEKRFLDFQKLLIFNLFNWPVPNVPKASPSVSVLDFRIYSLNDSFLTVQSKKEYQIIMPELSKGNGINTNGNREWGSVFFFQSKLSTMLSILPGLGMAIQVARAQEKVRKAWGQSRRESK
jgi:hypothetical protein